MDVYQKMLPLRTIEQAIAIRNQSWQKCELIPTWVNQEEVDLDCFYTHPDIAHECSESLYAVMEKDTVDLNKILKLIIMKTTFRTMYITPKQNGEI